MTLTQNNSAIAERTFDVARIATHADDIAGADGDLRRGLHLNRQELKV